MKCIYANTALGSGTSWTCGIHYTGPTLVNLLLLWMAPHEHGHLKNLHFPKQFTSFLQGIISPRYWYLL